jgi:hypothetical protein
MDFLKAQDIRPQPFKRRPQNRRALVKTGADQLAVIVKTVLVLITPD